MMLDPAYPPQDEGSRFAILMTVGTSADWLDVAATSTEPASPGIKAPFTM